MLETYWPKANEVNSCIKNEAETADVAVLLAVHQPTPLVRVNEGSNIHEPATEQDLLDAFLTENVPSGALLLPITGASGAGKSHIIRWLHAQLQRCEQRDRLHVIRIPKSASLRTVVELILEPLIGDERYAKIRENLAEAVGEVNIQTAVISFRAELENALGAKRAELQDALHNTPSDGSKLRPQIGHADMLPRLFTDAALDKHFLPILERVVKRAVQGRVMADENGEQEASEISQFRASDLDIPRTVNLDQASLRVREYCTKNLNSGADRVQQAVSLLNSVVDDAIAKVFRLEENTGGVTLQDIILAVREVLLKDGKDLVLLVEDFAALAGIQEVLLNVCIQEGNYEGRKVRATMRTALAITDGYLAFRQTILTRAQRQWLIGSREQQTDAELKSGVVNMVGAYLNAARWGEAELRRLFKSDSSGESLAGWLPVWNDESLDDNGHEALNAFGVSEQGHPLFPYNRQAIEYLAECHLKESGHLIFNPRRVINEILRGPLLMRGAFKRREFPPAEFQSAKANLNLAAWLRDTQRPEHDRARLATLMTVWGGNPKDENDIARIPPLVFTAFGLPTPEELANIKPMPSEPDRESSVEPVPEPPPQDNDPITKKWTKILDDWAGGTQIVQADANEIRKALSGMVQDSINLPALRLKEFEVTSRLVHIPNARGNLPSGPRVAICDDYQDKDGSVRKALLGAIRFSKNGKRWTYAEAADDYVACAPLIDRLVEEATQLALAKAQAETGVLAQALITQARIAGFGPSARAETKNTKALLSALFCNPDNAGTPSGLDAWDHIRGRAIGEQSGRNDLQQELLYRVAAYQGETGRTPFALDIVRITDAMRQNPAIDGVTFSAPVKSAIDNLKEGRLWSSLQPVLAKLREFKSHIGEFVDDDFDKGQFVTDLQQAVQLLSSTGTIHSVSNFRMGEFSQELERFRASPVKDLMERASSVLDHGKEQLPALLYNLGQMDLGLIKEILTFLAQTKTLVSTAEKTVEQEIETRSVADPDKLVAEITSQLVRMARAGAVGNDSQEAAE